MSSESSLVTTISNLEFIYNDTTLSIMEEMQKLPVLYTIFEGAVAIFATAGNLLVMIAFLQDKRLRRVTNFYIMSLAVADFLVGLIGVPSAILTRMGLPREAFHVCLTMLSLLIVLCTISILNLVAVSVDRFWAILFPLNYHSKMSSQAAGGIIISCWIAGALIGFLPLFGINNGPSGSNRCLFIPIMSYNFLVFLYFATIVFPALLMAAFYARIYMVVIGQIRTVSTISSFKGKSAANNSSTDSDNGLRRSRTFPVPLLTHRNSQPNSVSPTSKGHSKGGRRVMYKAGTEETSTFESASSSSCSENNSRRESLRKNRKAQANEHNNFDGNVKPIKFSYSRREVKKAQKLSIIVMFFIICWIPLYTVNAVQAFWPEVVVPSWLLDAFIILSHVNSAVNPLLYAYHMKDFREAFRRLLCLCECLISKDELRDRRRRELITLNEQRANYFRKTQLELNAKVVRDLNMISGSYPNSTITSPIHSISMPNSSCNLNHIATGAKVQRLINGSSYNAHT